MKNLIFNNECDQEISNGERFQFSKNWALYLKLLYAFRISETEVRFKKILDVKNLHCKTFLDIESGTGTLSLV